MVVPQAVEQPVHREQAKLGNPIGSLAHGALPWVSPRNMLIVPSLPL